MNIDISAPPAIIVGGDPVENPTRGSVSGILFSDDFSAVLAVLQLEGYMRGFWGLPGGKIEPGESVAVALSREFKEETGLVVEESMFVGIKNCRRGSFYHHSFHWIQKYSGQLSSSEGLDGYTGIIETSVPKWISLQDISRIDNFKHHHGFAIYEALKIASGIHRDALFGLRVFSF